METIAAWLGLGVIAISLAVAVYWKIEKNSAINRLKYRHRNC